MRAVRAAQFAISTKLPAANFRVMTRMSTTGPGNGFVLPSIGKYITPIVMSTIALTCQTGFREMIPQKLCAFVSKRGNGRPGRYQHGTSCSLLPCGQSGFQINLHERHFSCEQERLDVISMNFRADSIFLIFMPNWVHIPKWRMPFSCSVVNKPDS